MGRRGKLGLAMKKIRLSVVIPLYNEEENIRLLHGSVSDALRDIGEPYEIIIVDDGSKDRTFELARELAVDDPRLRVLKFRRNYGQTPAMVAGIEHARGSIIVTMDGDLQNDPTDIPRFIEKIEEGFDIVVGWRHDRQDKFLTRVLPSKIANWLIGKVTGVPIKDNGCSLKAYRADIIKNIPLYSEMHRFIPATMSLAGAKIAEIKVKHHARRFGVSKYGLSRVYRVLIDLLIIRAVVLWSSRPILSFVLVATVAGVISVALFIYEGIGAFLTGSQPSVMAVGLALMWGALAMFLVALGLLSLLIYEKGKVRNERFAMLTARASPPVVVLEKRQGQ